MDPLTITGACVGLLASITTLSLKATEVVGQFRDARKDMEAVRSELSALSLCTETLRNDASNPQIIYPSNVQASLVEVLRNCEVTTNEILALLNKLASNSLGRRIQRITVQGDVGKLRSHPGAQKATISIALDMTNVLLVSAVAEETAQIHADTVMIPRIKDDTSQLLHEISQLKAQLAQIKLDNAQPTFAMQRFLDETSTVLDDPGHTGDTFESPFNSTYPLQSATNAHRLVQTPAPDPREQSVQAADRLLTSVERLRPLTPCEKAKKARAALRSADKQKLDKQFINLFKCFLDLGSRTSVRDIDSGKLPPPDKVRELLERGADIDTVGNIDWRGWYQYTALTVALGAQHANEILSLLLTFEPNLNQGFKGQGSCIQPMSVTVYCDRLDNMALLLDHGADPNSSENFYGGALAYACSFGKLEFATLLLDRGANVNLRGGIFGSPLNAACRCGDNAVVEFLISRGADVNLDCSGDIGNPIHAALNSRSDTNNEVLATLLKHGAKPGSIKDRFKVAKLRAKF